MSAQTKKKKIKELNYKDLNSEAILNYFAPQLGNHYEEFKKYKSIEENLVNKINEIIKYLNK